MPVKRSGSRKISHSPEFIKDEPKKKPEDEVKLPNKKILLTSSPFKNYRSRKINNTLELLDDSFNTPRFDTISSDDEKENSLQNLIYSPIKMKKAEKRSKESPLVQKLKPKVIKDSTLFCLPD